MNNNEKNTLRRFGKILAYTLFFVTVIVLSLSVFFTFRHTLIHFSLDFYYPFLLSLNKVESSLALEALQRMPKQKLAELTTILTKQNAILAAQNSKDIQIRDENNELRSMLSLSPYKDFQSVYAEIIARNPASWTEQFVVSKGRTDNISRGDAVLAAISSPQNHSIIPVFVGRVTEVSNHTAVIATIINSQCQLSVKLNNSGAVGTMKGDGGLNGTACVSQLSKDINVNTGELVNTSGLTNRIPQGISVGRVSSTKRDNSGSILYKDITITPLVSLETLRFVLILSQQKKD